MNNGVVAAAVLVIGGSVACFSRTVPAKFRSGIISQRCRPALVRTRRCSVPPLTRVWATTTGQTGAGLADHPRTRFLSVFGALLAMVLTGAWSASVSTASPPGDPAPGQCDFLLTPPEVVQISGVSFATATVKPGPCTMHASPNYSMVCLSMQGEDSSGQCASKSGGRPAVVYYAYRPGATYVVTGQGCASTFAPPYTMCQDLGPSHFTL